MLKIIGVFETPSGIDRFGEFQVFDLRLPSGGVRPAEWEVVENEAVVCIVLNATTVKPVGSYRSGGGYLKWDISINLTEDVRVLALTPGTDVSRSGCHGTQQYSYLATDLCDCKATRISYPVSWVTKGLEWVRPVTKKHTIPSPERGYGMEANLYEVGLKYASSYSVESGTSPDHMRRQTRRIPGRAEVVVGGTAYEVGTEYEIPAVIAKIREILPERSFGLDEAILSEEFLASQSVDTVRALVQLYRKHGKVETAELCADYASRKVEEEAFKQSGGVFNLSGHFRRMGNSRNGDLWVIRPDGSLREPDEIVRRKEYPEGSKRWVRIQPDELAISWGVYLQRDVYLGSTCRVLHEPKNGRTPAQFDALRRIEEEVGVQAGSFGSSDLGSSLKVEAEYKPATIEDLMAKFNRKR